jgi:hypothetical protein
VSETETTYPRSQVLFAGTEVRTESDVDAHVESMKQQLIS